LPAARSLPRSRSGACARARMPATATATHGCLRRSGTDVAHERARQERESRATARRGGWTRIVCTVVLEASSRARNDLRQCSSASTAIALKVCREMLRLSLWRKPTHDKAQWWQADCRVCVRVRCVLCVRACAHLRGCTRMWARHRSGD
jgi:hypothetical protein